MVSARLRRGVVSLHDVPGWIVVFCFLLCLLSGALSTAH